MNDDELRKLIEGYQPGSDEPGDVEFSALREAASHDARLRAQLEAVQAWDSQLSRAMRDVPVPPELADRLLESLGQPATPEEAAPEEAAPEEPAREQPHTPADDEHAGAAGSEPLGTPPTAWWNRWPTRVAAVAMALSAVLVLCLYLTGWNDHLTATQVASKAQGWITQLDPEAWQRTIPPRDDYRHSAIQFPLNAWQHFSVPLDDQAIAYQGLVPPARSRAWLLVITTRKGRLLPSRPPTVPDSTTGNVCIGVWKSDDKLYVLAVQGTQQTYRRLLRTNAIALLAWPFKAT